MKLGLSIGYSGAKLAIPIERIQLAEHLGHDSVWTAEADGSDAITPLAWIAAETEQTDHKEAVELMADLAGTNATS